MYQVCTRNGHPLFILSQYLTDYSTSTDLYLNLICRNFLLSQNLIFSPTHVVPLHDFSIWFYTTCTFDTPLRGFSIWSYTNYAFVKPLRAFSTYTFEKPLRGFSIWSYTNYTFEKQLHGFSKTMHIRI